MPGLFGVIGLAGRTVADGSLEVRLAEMADRLAHEPGDGVRWWRPADGRCVIGRVGDARWQPAQWPQEGATAAAVAAGRLHPHGLSCGELADAVAEQGSAAFGRLRGFWTAAATDARHAVYVATDRHSSHPLCYATSDDLLIFAPEPKALLAFPVRRELDEAAVATMLAGGFPPTDRTSLRGIRRLPGGACLVVTPENWSIEHYWRYRLAADGDGTADAELAAELGRLVREAARHNLEEPDATAILLSGGTDSRACLAGAHDVLGAQISRVRTYNWIGADHDRPGTDDAVAKQLAKQLHLRHEALPRPIDNYFELYAPHAYITEGTTDYAAFHPYELANTRAIAQAGRFVLHRGDEALGWRFPVATVDEALREVSLRPLSSVGSLSAYFRPAAYGRLTEASDAVFAALRDRYADVGPVEAKDLVYYEQRLQSYLHQMGYVKTTVCDHRNPLLDEDIVDFMQRVPQAGRIEKALFKQAMERTFPALWRVPFAHLANLVDWIGELSRDSAVRRYVAAELGDDASSIWEYFDPAATRALFASLGSGGRRIPLSLRIKRKVWSVGRRVVSLAPGLRNRLRQAYRRDAVRADEFFFRFVSLKLALDVFVVGDGSRAAWEAWRGGVERRMRDTASVR